MNESWSCAMWNYWLLHVLGINLWIVFMYLRLFDRFMIFSRRLRELTDIKKEFVRLGILFGMSAVPVVVAANVTWAGLSVYSEVIKLRLLTLANWRCPI